MSAVPTCADGVVVDVGNTDGALIELLPTAQPGVPPLPAAEQRHAAVVCVPGAYMGLHRMQQGGAIVAEQVQQWYRAQDEM